MTQALREHVKKLIWGLLVAFLAGIFTGAIIGVVLIGDSLFPELDAQLILPTLAAVATGIVAWATWVNSQAAKANAEATNKNAQATANMACETSKMASASMDSNIVARMALRARTRPWLKLRLNIVPDESTFIKTSSSGILDYPDAGAKIIGVPFKYEVTHYGPSPAILWAVERDIQLIRDSDYPQVHERLAIWARSRDPNPSPIRSFYPEDAPWTDQPKTGVITQETINAARKRNGGGLLAQAGKLKLETKPRTEPIAFIFLVLIYTTPDDQDLLFSAIATPIEQLNAAGIDGYQRLISGDKDPELLLFKRGPEGGATYDT